MILENSLSSICKKEQNLIILSNDLNEQDAIAKKKTSTPPPNLPIFKWDDIWSEEKFMEISSLFDYESKINELRSEFEMMPQTLETLKKRKMRN